MNKKSIVMKKEKDGYAVFLSLYEGLHNVKNNNEAVYIMYISI